MRVSGASSVGFFNDEESRKIDQCTDFRELFFHLRHHWDWDDLIILESIVHLCETKEGEQEMSKYRKKLALYGGLNLVFDRNKNDPPPGYEDYLAIVNNELTVEQFESTKQYILDILQHLFFPYIHLHFNICICSDE